MTTTNNTIKTASGGHAASDKVKYGSFIHVVGSGHSDRITGDNQGNTLTGGAGNDTLKGDDGDDTLIGGPGGDTLDGGDGDMDIATYANATEGVTIDLSSVSESNNVITIRNSGGRGDARGDRFIDIENFIGSPHDDTFIAGPEADDVDGLGGSNTISYERSRDPVIVDISSNAAQSDTQDESRENYNYAKGDILTNIDNIIGSNVSSSSAKIHGVNDEFHDVLTGNSDDNEIDGRGGDDSINGGGGNDTLIGGSGSDTLTGAGGMDTFVISGRDTITDFEVGDKLSFGSSSRTLNLNYTTDGNVVITSGSHQVTLETITGINDLTAANFIFNPDGYVKLTDNNPTGTATRGNSTIHGGEGDNRLTGGSNIDTINGNGGDDTISGGNGNDILNGDAGDDTIEGGAGEDTMAGGEGNDDTLSYASSSRGTTTETTDVPDPNPRSGVTVTLNDVGTGTGENIGTHALGDTIIGGFENLIGSRYDDRLEGNSSENVIKGGSGNDWLVGGGGGDHLEGGSGKDRIIAGDNDDFLSYESSSSRVIVDLSDAPQRAFTDAEKGLFTELTDDTTSTNAVIKVSSGDASGDIATGFANVIGGRGGDALTGDDQVNELRGMGGNDELTGGTGDDTLMGGEGRDMLKGGTGEDTLDGGPGADDLDGGGTENDGENDTATYASATEGVTVDLSGGNRGEGDADGDSFDGIEQYVGSYHADIFISGDDPDHITGGPATGDPGGSGDTSNDTVSYVRSDEGVTVDLATGAQSLTDNGYASGDDLNSIENVIGSNHKDTLTAADGGSVITGGREDDILAGGAGNDTFVFASGDGDDQINSFTITDGQDKIDLSAFTSIASLDDLKGEISLRDSDTDIKIDLPGGGEISLNNVTNAGLNANDRDFYGLTADNFIFYTKRISGNMGDRFNNEINGGRGNDAIYGEQGRDTMNGGASDDEMYGGEDKDILNGGEGNDWLDGGEGDDTFVFEPGNGNDHIMDFTSGEDKIDLSAFTNDDGTPFFTNTNAPDGDPDGDNYVITLPEAFGGGTITILGVTSLANDDFML